MLLDLRSVRYENCGRTAGIVCIVLLSRVISAESPFCVVVGCQAAELRKLNALLLESSAVILKSHERMNCSPGFLRTY